jgi:hypothetical protein
VAVATGLGECHGGGDGVQYIYARCRVNRKSKKKLRTAIDDA